MVRLQIVFPFDQIYSAMSNGPVSLKSTFQIYVCLFSYFYISYADYSTTAAHGILKSVQGKSLHLTLWEWRSFYSAFALCNEIWSYHASMPLNNLEEFCFVSLCCFSVLGIGPRVFTHLYPLFIYLHLFWDRLSHYGIQVRLKLPVLLGQPHGSASLSVEIIAITWIYA